MRFFSRYICIYFLFNALFNVANSTELINRDEKPSLESSDSAVKSSENQKNDLKNKKWSFLISSISEKMQIKHIDQFGSTAGDDVVLSEKGIGFSGVIDLLTNRTFGLRGTVDYDSFKGASSDNSLYCP
ncbi:MAG: hypothetical protein L6Q37_02610 [Bdellovibrionaceae bacterium]|nr:hypothetical protein [Pseudobdellovibrionaceae bacterium]NUM58713.1 hypothetical protein [Pseudobdellovibrionaceae bacterium]